jgi:hypothetical protein
LGILRIEKTEVVMRARWIRRVAVIVTLVMTPGVMFAAPREPRWLTKTDAGVIVEVTMKTGESFEAIWMGRDGDRAVLERLNPDETVSVPIGSVRAMRTLKAPSPASAQAYGVLGAAAGFGGALWVLARLILPRT